jgi:N-acetylmuramoyl-L-alanine amidase
MKNLVQILLLLLFPEWAFSQITDLYSQIKERIDWVLPDINSQKIIEFSPRSIFLYSDSSKENVILKIVSIQDYERFIYCTENSYDFNTFSNCLNLELIPTKKLSEAKTGLQGKKIAIDPGHFAHNLTVAKMESKYVSSLYEGKQAHIYEADLTAQTAWILQKMLEEKGAQVLLTRKLGTSSLDVNFEEWFKKSRIGALQKLKAEGGISEKEFDELYKSKNKSLWYKKVFRKLEFDQRVEKINKFNPDISVFIHYNIDENNHPNSDGNMYLHIQNYSMVFIPGAFAHTEIIDNWEKIRALYWMLTPNFKSSIQASKMLQSEFEQNLGVLAVTAENELNYLKKYSVNIENYPGLYARNLYLTRYINSPLIFGESLLQDNVLEFSRLIQKDTVFNEIPISSRLLENAQAYFNALSTFFNE